MKKYFISMLVFLFVVTFSSARQAFAQETRSFEGVVQIKVGTKNFKEEVSGTADIAASDEGGSAFEDATLDFEFGAVETECGDTLSGETIPVYIFPQEGEGSTSSKRVYLEIDSNNLMDFVARFLEKHGSTVQDELNLGECFSTTMQTNGSNNVNFWIDNYSSTAYIRKASIRVNFRVESVIAVYDADWQNEKRYKQRFSVTLKIPLDESTGT